MSLTGIGQALSNTYLCFAIFAFLNAVGTAGVFPLAFIIGEWQPLVKLRILKYSTSYFRYVCVGVEMVGLKKREMTGIVLNYFYAIGEATVGVLAWLCRDWVLLQYLISAPGLIFIVYYW